MLKIALAIALTLPAVQAFANAQFPMPTDGLVALCGSTMDLQKCKKIKLLPTTLNAESLKKVKSSIDSAMDTWGDTVLEGDVNTDYKDMKIDSTKKIVSRAGDLVGFLVRFSTNGWDTSTCKNPDATTEKPETMAGCEMGRIGDTIFVTPKLDDFEELDPGAELQ